MEIPNISTNNGSADWGLHRFNDGIVFHCARNPNGFWTAIGPAKKLVEPIKLELGKLEIEDCACKFWAQDRMHDKIELIESKESKYMSFHPPIIIEDGGSSCPAGGNGTPCKSAPGKTLPHKKGGLIKKESKSSKPAKTVKKSVKKAVKKSKKS